MRIRRFVFMCVLPLPPVLFARDKELHIRKKRGALLWDCSGRQLENKEVCLGNYLLLFNH